MSRGDLEDWLGKEEETLRLLRLAPQTACYIGLGLDCIAMMLVGSLEDSQGLGLEISDSTEGLRIRLEELDRAVHRDTVDCFANHAT